MPKEKREKKGPGLRHAPLAKQMTTDPHAVRQKHKTAGKRPKRGKRDDDEENGPEYLAPELSKRILAQAREQREEVEREEKEHVSSVGGSKQRAPFYEGLDSDASEGGDDDEAASDEDEIEEELVVEDGDYVDAQGMTEEEERLVGAFMNTAGFQRRNLADMIMEKIKEKEDAETTQQQQRSASQAPAGEDEDGDAAPAELPPKVVEVYTAIGKMLSHYTAGKLPKAFKIIPSLSNWEQILYLTNPDSWSPHAVYAATRIFASNLNPHMAQRFYNVFLLERCRRDMADNKRLNYHLYEALKKSVYKPAAFFKGILLPLAASGNCTLREATIFGSVLAKVSIPANHAAVALLKLAEMPYSGATSMFVRVLLNKKYALPHRVIAALVDHFSRFVGETRELPVLWHQSLLAFVQRYRGNITPRDKERIKELLRAQPHRLITDEVRRELFGAAARADQALAAVKQRGRAVTDDGGDAMEL